MNSQKNRNQRSCVLIRRKHKSYTDTISPEKSLNAFLSPSLCEVCDTGGGGITGASHILEIADTCAKEPSDYMTVIVK